MSRNGGVVRIYWSTAAKPGRLVGGLLALPCTFIWFD